MFKTILIPLVPDEPVTWQKALPVAVGLAQAHEAELVLTHIIPDFGSSIVASYFPDDFREKALERSTSELAELASSQLPADLPHKLVSSHGRIWQEICHVAAGQEAGLIVMASHKPGLSDVLLAPTADQVLRHTPISVMIIR